MLGATFCTKKLVGSTVTDIVLNPPVSFPIMVSKARTILVVFACCLGVIINLVPVLTIVFPAVVTSPRKVDAAFVVPVTAPSGATSKLATVSSDRITFYPKVLLAPGMFVVDCVIVVDFNNDVNEIAEGDTLITGMPVASFGKVTSLYRSI